MPTRRGEIACNKVDTAAETCNHVAMTNTETPRDGSSLTYDVRSLASGTLVLVASDGSVEPFRCAWLVQVPNGNPEPDSIEDCYDIRECGARLRSHQDYPNAEPGEAMACGNGHEHLSYALDAAPFGPAWEREMADRYAETGQVLA